MAKIETRVLKSPRLENPIINFFYEGYILVKNDEGRYMYSKFTGITRLTREDALNDAIILKNDLLGES